MTQVDVSILNAAREASDMLAGIANERRNESIFIGNGLVGDADEIIQGATRNFMKFVLYALGGQFREREGQSPDQVNMVESTEYEVPTTERYLAARVNKSLLRRLADGHRTEVENRLNAIVDEWIGDVDQRLTTLLEDGDQSTAVNLINTGGAFFGTSITIPGSSQTLTNLLTQTFVTSAATVKTAIFRAMAQFSAMRNAHASLLNQPSDVEPVVVMYKPDDTNNLLEKFIDAVEPTLLVASGGSNTLRGRVRLVENPYLAADTAFWAFMRVGQDRALMYGEVPPGPELLTNAGNGPTTQDIDQLLNARDTYVAQYDSAVAYGSPFKAIQVNNS